MGEIVRVQIARVGVDLAKQVIQVHAVDGAGRRVAARAVKRDQFVAWCAQLPAGCVVAMQACSGAPLGSGVTSHGPGCAADCSQLRQPVPHGRAQRQKTT